MTVTLNSRAVSALGDHVTAETDPVTGGVGNLTVGGRAAPVPYILAQNGVPMILPSSGSIGDNGALTLTTALPATYSGGCYMRFPANAIAAGVAAGLYYVVMSSTTAGTIYNNTYSSGAPSIPASPAAFATTGPGAYTQATSEVTMLSSTLPGGLMGASGRMETLLLSECPSNANNKTSKAKLGATIYLQTPVTTGVASRVCGTVQNLGAAALQRVFAGGSGLSYADGLSSSNAMFSATENTAADLIVLVTGQLAAATDFIVFNHASHVVYPS